MNFEKMDKIFSIVMLVLCAGFFVAGCGAQLTAEQQSLLTDRLEKLGGLSEDLTDAYARYKTGELTVGELNELQSAIKTQITQTQAEVNELKQEGVSTGGMIIAALTAFLARGIPSKGPIALALNGIVGVFNHRPTPKA